MSAVYFSQGKQALANITATIESGEKVGVVGRSGAGKVRGGDSL